MSVQNYSNHSRYYTPHHFIFYPILLILIAVSTYQTFNSDSQSLLWFMVTCLIALMGYLSFMLRQHYALGNQNRIVRLEMRFRYYVLTQQRFELLEDKLSLSQIFALRFASDEELPTLTQCALKENLSGDQIKQAIKAWVPDEMRV